MMRSTYELSIEKIQPEYFQDFFQTMIPIVETHLNSLLISPSPFRKKLHTVLCRMSWEEWQTKSDQISKPLSRILVTLLYDKILITLEKLEKTPELIDFFEKVSYLFQPHMEASSNLEELISQFINLLNEIWNLANNTGSRTPILDYNDFPLNQLFELIDFDWNSCLATINLIQKVKRKDGKVSSQLLLPYIFEIGIPDYLKQVQGQVFTPLQVVDFICSQNITEKTIRIIDPACGTGLFLLGALQVLYKSMVNRSHRIELIGVEKDPVLADIAESAVNYFLQKKLNSLVDWTLYRNDFLNYTSDSVEFSKKNSGMTTFLMNPPYTRHEILSPEYKEFLKGIMDRDLREVWGYDPPKISGRSGLYVYFMVHATCFLEEGDNFGLIIPNSWLDVDYGQPLQRFVLNHYQIESIVNCRLKKIIPTADVNTAIMKFKRKKFNSIQDKNLVNFVSLDNPLELESLIDNQPFQLNEKTSPPRIISVKQKELYTKSKWGVYFRAPLNFLKLMDSIDEKLINLRNLAEVQRGFTSGANDFFYVGKPGKSNLFFKSSYSPNTGDLELTLKNELVIKQFKEQGFDSREPMFTIEKEYWMHPDNIELKRDSYQYIFTDEKGSNWVPNYLVKTPRDLKRYEIQEEDLKYVVIMIISENSFDELKEGIQEYIRWGEKWNPSVGKKFHQRPTCCSRKNWYHLPSKDFESFKLLCLMTINDRFPFFYNPRGFYFDARFYGVNFLQEDLQQNKQLFASYFLFLNSSLCALQLELLGRSNLGEGGLDIKVYEYELLKVPCSKSIVNAKIENINEVFRQTLHLPPFSVVMTIPERIKQITDEFLTTLFSLSLESLDNLYQDLKNIVRMRIEKAR